MRLTWLISGEVTGDSPAAWDCTLASVRYRVLAPARVLLAAGHQPQWLRLDRLKTDTLDVEQRAALGADVVIVSKVLAAGSTDIARAARDLGAKVVVDLCDDHFDTPTLSKAYRELCLFADRITASTPAMSDVIFNRISRPAAVVGDPFEGPAAPPRFAPNPHEGVRLLWFGHPVNFDTLLPLLPGLQELSRTTPLVLTLVSDLNAARQSPLLQHLISANGPRFKIHLTAWSQQAVWNGLADCDAVMVPSLPEAKKQVKSPNRVVEGIRAGRLVLAYPLPSYEPLAAGCLLGTDLTASLRQALAEPDAMTARIAAGQALIEREHHPEHIGRQWEQLLQQVAEQEPLLI